MTSKKSNSRYVVLDSYRALAALLVVAFHYFHRWSVREGQVLLPDIPWMSSNAIISHGAFGVEFFFIISGFVIALTLHSTNSLPEFAIKRFARLFPAMLVCSLTIFLVVSVLQVKPLSDVNAIDFLPSLTFISPVFYNKVFGINSDWISGVYWSLFVEVKFYLYVSIIYFVSRTHVLRNYLFFSILFCVAFWASRYFSIEKMENLIKLVFYPKYAGFFLAGMAFHSIYKDCAERRQWSAATLAIGTIYSLTIYSPFGQVWEYSFVATGVVSMFFLLFLLFVVDSPVVKVFELKWLAKIGAASYSLYLLHESIGVSVIHRLNGVLGTSVIWTLLVLVGVILLSILFYDHVETPARRHIRSASKKLLPQYS